MLLHPLQNMVRFDFFRSIKFVMYLDIIFRYIANTMNPEKQKVKRREYLVRLNRQVNHAFSRLLSIPFSFLFGEN
jgi:hypothetical protein